MNSKLAFENYLLVLKSTVEVYIHGTLESSNNDVRSKLQDSLNDYLEMQNDTYQLMVNNGWYQVTNANDNEIMKIYNKLISEN